MNKYQKALNLLAGEESSTCYECKTYHCEHCENFKESIEVFRELVEKATSKKGVWKYDNFGDGTLCCPNCKKPIVNVWSKAEYKPNYCHCCGQSLNWSENDE